MQYSFCLFVCAQTLFFAFIALCFPHPYLSLILCILLCLQKYQKQLPAVLTYSNTEELCSDGYEEIMIFGEEVTTVLITIVSLLKLAHLGRCF